MAYRLGGLCLFAALGILYPGFRQKELGADWPMEKGTARRVISQELNTDYDLAVANLAQGSR
ncbi:hypothetical protein KSZ_04860 [Dictyobacter formicarum]|uniref:Uncharacterized protein n=1 Tax=Dictyobacter formicarum TaxID=2778368 RepID=A0ABQ3V992_9CHLR|nr:hypothetical protein KSZ_04860 [Dictyobacter formicarum]